jgi:uncharacterized membrane protein YfcA
MTNTVLILIAGLLAGAMNALAGGGSFVSLPALIAVGLPSVGANITSTVALLPGSLASALVYRRGVAGDAPFPMRAMAAVTAVGGLAGSLLLLTTPSNAFDRVVPWLLLLATVVLASAGTLSAWLARRRVVVGAPVLLATQFVLGVYGGYFGGAVGIMMMAAWSLLVDADLTRLQAPRTLLVSLANAVAVAVFALSGAVHWREALVVGLGATAGGYAGARFARALPTGPLRLATVLLCATVTVLFFLRQT